MFSDVDLVQQYNLIAPANIIRVARLPLFTGIIHKQSSAIINLINASVDNITRSIDALQFDLTLVSTMFPALCSCNIIEMGKNIIEQGHKLYYKHIRKYVSSPYA